MIESDKICCTNSLATLIGSRPKEVPGYNKMNKTLDKLSKQVINKKCWNAGRSYGTMILLDFGTKVPYKSPRYGNVYRGEWTLILEQCDWYLRKPDQEITSSHQPSTHIDQNIKILEGRKIKEINISDTTDVSTFIFDDKLILTTYPYDKTSEQWLLYAPTGQIIIKGPKTALHIENTRARTKTAAGHL